MRLFTSQVMRIVLIFSLLAIIEKKSSGQMRQVYSDLVSTNNEIQKISFYSPSSGYIASTDNSFDWVGFTSDSGRTFIKRFITLSNVNYNGYSVNITFGFGIKGVKAFNQDTLIAYGDYGLVPAILYSTNGGISYLLVYHSQFSPTQLSGGITDMVFPQNNNIGYAVDADRILKTTNKGVSWSTVRTDPDSYFDFLEAVDNNNVFAFSTSYNSSKLLKSANAGSTWQLLTIPAPTIFYAHFLTANKGWLNIRDNNDSLRLYYTANGGSSWSQKNNATATPFFCYKMKFVNDSTGYSIGNYFDTYKTSDSGKVWQPLPRDNNFSYLYYSHNDIQCLSENQLWCGGVRDFLEISTNGGGTPFPKAFFKIDTTGLSVTNTVNLYNYSKPAYSFRWYKNDVLIGTSYNTSYIHNINNLHDSIKLVVTNGINSDSLTLHQYFFLPVTVSSFSPVIGATGTAVTITGLNFSGATAVRFGGTSAGNYTVVSNTQINAVVGNGASGAVSVTTSQGTGSLSGFTYYPPPIINLPTTISDSILCKAESINVFIQNTEPNVRYELIDSLNISYGSVNSNGGTVGFYTSPISRTANYKIKATRLNVTSTSTFTNKIFILVEHTKSVFTATRVNILPGQKVNFHNQSKEASTFAWTFNQDASIPSSTLPNPQNISYLAAGLKTLSLISTSINGCRDTIAADAVLVYNKPIPDDVCYAQNINDSDFAYIPDSPPSIDDVISSGDNGYIIGGAGNKPKLKSRIGVTKNLTPDGTAYLAKYTTDGVLSWFIYIRNSGNFYETERDNNGNFYVLGSCKVQNYLTLTNGDSIRVSATPTDTLSYSTKKNGFILKLDSAGNYLWHTIINDPSAEFQGYPVQGGFPKKIKLLGNQIAISGPFLANLGYCRNGVKQTLVSLPNSTNINDLQNNFIIRIKDDGTLLWHMYFENDATNQKRDITGIGIDAGKNYYISGFYESQVVIHDVGNVNNIIYNGSVGDASSYVLKFDSSGRLIWKVNMTNSFAFRDIFIRALITDSGSGTTYVTGRSSLLNSSQYFQITNRDGSISNVSLASFFLLKLDSSGMYKWGQGSRYSYYGQGSSVLLKGSDIYLTGVLSDNGQLSSQFTITSSDGCNPVLSFHETEFFIAHYDTAGILRRVTKSGQNTGGHLVPNNLVTDNNQNFIISGMTDNWNGGNSSFTAFTSAINTNGMDAFFLKLNPNYCYSTTPPIAQAGPDKTKCSGDTAMIGIAATGNSYYWISSPSGFVSTLPNPIVSPVVTTSYFLTVINQFGLIARDTVNITIIPSPAANAGIDQTICTGSSVTIGSAPVAGNNYSWTSNPVGFVSTVANPTVSPIITTQYFLSVTNASGCTGKDTVVITAQSTFASAVSISASSSTICSGSAVTFTASPTNGGATPAFQWQINGVNAGVNSPVFITNILTNGNQIKVIMTSSLSCASPATANSNVITMTVNNSVSPAITITGNTVVVNGQSTTLIGSPNNGGTTPAYQWQDSTATHTWQNISGATTASLIYTPVQTGNKVRCRLTSNANCANPATVTSNALTFTVNTATAINPVPGSNFGIRYYPNPVNTVLFIDSLKLTDKWQTLEVISIDGRRVIPITNIINRIIISVNTERLPGGQYIALLRRKNGTMAYLKFIKQ